MTFRQRDHFEPAMRHTELYGIDVRGQIEQQHTLTQRRRKRPVHRAQIRKTRWTSPFKDGPSVGQARADSSRNFSATCHPRTSSRASEDNTTQDHMQAPAQQNHCPHAPFSHTPCSHRVACVLLAFTFQMFTHYSYLHSKCGLLLFTLHMFVYCIHITDGCI